MHSRHYYSTPQPIAPAYAVVSSGSGCGGGCGCSGGCKGGAIAELEKSIRENPIACLIGVFALTWLLAGKK